MQFNFLIAGAQKCGTTAMHSFLKAHPDLYFPRRKEVHFFDNEQRNWNDPDYSKYEELLSSAPNGATCGEATPIYLFWPGAMERIKTYNPAMKLIIILRNPIDRAYSHWRMECMRDQETESFSTAIRRSSLRAAWSQHDQKPFRKFTYVERGFYDEQLLNVFANFPLSQVLTLKFDDYQRDRDSVLDRVTDFLRVPKFKIYPENRTIVPVKARRQDMGKVDIWDEPMSREDRDYLRGIYEPHIKQLAKMVPFSVAAWLEA